MPEKETRTIAIEDIELRSAGDESDTPTISGYGAVYGSASLDLGGFREIIDPHAFDRSLKGRGEIRSFFNHDPSKPLASLRAGNLTLKSDDRGLFYEIKPPNTTYANDVVEAVRAKLVRGSSFSFLTRTDSWHEEKGVQIRTLLDVDLLEVGPVTTPAYEKTTSQVRSMLEARGLTLDGERAEQLPDIMALLADWQPKDEAELRVALATLTALLPSDDPPPADDPPFPYRLALARRRLQLAQLAK